MKRKYVKGSRKGTKKRGKTTEKMATEFEDGCIPSSPTKGNMDMQPNPRTRSQAATIGKCPVRIPDLKLEKGTKTKSPRLTCARRCVEKSDRDSTTRGKQPIEEFTAESTTHENQDTFPSFIDSFKKFLADRNSVPSSNELVQNILSSTIGKEKTDAQKAHSFQLTEMAAMAMDHDPSDADVELHQPRNSIIPSSAELIQRNLTRNVAKDINEAQQEARSMEFMEMAAMMNPDPLDADVELHQPRNPTVPSAAALIQSNLPCNVAKDINEAQQEARSMGFTEMAAVMCHGPSDDGEEADSSSRLISVEGYLVKAEIAPILKKIIEKYKDIAKECTIKEKGSRVPILQMICLTCQELGERSFNDVNDDWLRGMLWAVKSFQNMGFDVRWLSERLEDICKLKRLIQLRPGIQEAVTKKNLQQSKIKMLRHQIDLLKQQLSAEETDLFATEKELDKAIYDFDQDMNDLKPKGFLAWSQDLLYGLL